MLIVILAAVALGLTIVQYAKVAQLSHHPDFPTLTQAAGRLILRWSWWVYLFAWDVIVFDLDYLKQINTVTGDQGRSDAILAPGMNIRQTSFWKTWRIPDVFLYTQFDNGDKFMVLVRRGCGPMVAERMRVHLQNADMYEHERSALMQYTGRDYVSATYAVVPNTRAILHAITHCDRMLFDAKELGMRNTVVTEDILYADRSTISAS